MSGRLLLVLGLLVGATDGCASRPPSPEPMSAAITQADVLGAVGRWLGGRGNEGSEWYVDATFLGHRSYVPEDVPELRGAITAFEPQLTADSMAALTEALPAVALQFVPDRAAVVDRAGPNVLGCHPYMGNRPMLRLGSPLHREVAPGAFYVEVNFDRGCQGSLYLLEVAFDGLGNSVLRVMREGGWIV